MPATLEPKMSRRPQTDRCKFDSGTYAGCRLEHGIETRAPAADEGLGWSCQINLWQTGIQFGGGALEKLELRQVRMRVESSNALRGLRTMEGGSPRWQRSPQQQAAGLTCFRGAGRSRPATVPVARHVVDRYLTDVVWRRMKTCGPGARETGVRRLGHGGRVCVPELLEERAVSKVLHQAKQIRLNRHRLF